MSNNRAGPVPSTFFGQVHDHGDETRISLATTVFPLVFIHTEDAYSRQVGGVVVDQVTGLVECDLVDRVPADVQGLRDRGHAHPVDGQALQGSSGCTAGSSSVSVVRSRAAAGRSESGTPN